MSIVLIVFLAIIGLIDADCDKGWNPYYSHCYKVSTEKTFSQSDAEKACNQDNAHLVSIHSDGENKLVRALIFSANPTKDAYFWIGLKLTRNPTTHNIMSSHWNDGSEMGYGDPNGVNAGQGPWARQKDLQPEPNNNLGNEACVVVAQAENGWMQFKCEDRAFSAFHVCKK